MVSVGNEKTWICRKNAFTYTYREYTKQITNHELVTILRIYSVRTTNVCLFHTNHELRTVWHYLNKTYYVFYITWISMFLNSSRFKQNVH